MSAPAEFVTLREAARRVGVHPKRIYRARDQGALEVYQLGERWQRVAWRDVVRWVARHRKKGSTGTNGNPAKSLS